MQCKHHFLFLKVTNLKTDFKNRQYGYKLPAKGVSNTRKQQTIVVAGGPNSRTVTTRNTLLLYSQHLCLLNGKVNEHNGQCPVFTFCHLRMHGNKMSNQIRQHQKKPKQNPSSVSPLLLNIHVKCVYMQQNNIPKFYR